MTVNEMGSEENTATTTRVIHLLKAPHFLTNRKEAYLSWGMKFQYTVNMHRYMNCLLEL